jgi:hypothetical protein
MGSRLLIHVEALDVADDSSMFFKHICTINSFMHGLLRDSRNVFNLDMHSKYPLSKELQPSDGRNRNYYIANNGIAYINELIEKYEKQLKRFKIEREWALIDETENMIDELKSIKAVIKHKLCENDKCQSGAIVRLVFENQGTI